MQPVACRGLDVLLATPFRYDAPYPTGSRFRRAGRTAGVFYAAERPETAVAEMAFYRLLFFAESPATPRPDGVAEFTAFAARIATPRALDLTLSGLCASTSMMITIHPQMLDLASMSQFLLMTHDLLAVVGEAGGRLKYDFIRYLVTRYEPQDGPQTKVVALLRNLFGNHVLTNPMVKSTAVSCAGLTKQTLYEIGRENMTRATYDLALEALDSVNAEIQGLIRRVWGRNPR